ncbi:MAG TPA: 6-phosphogluconolactonase [Actinomycetales bacterium]|nr:6-phosphogluconolactonase [Actinomycetales bacterium]
MSRRVVVHPNQDILAAATAARVVTKLIDLQSEAVPVHWVLTGGTVGIGTLAEMAKLPAVAAVDWSGVHIWWGDERFVPAGDGERNEVQAREALLDFLITEHGLPQAHIHPMAAPGSPGVETAEEAAAAYCAELAEFAQAGALVPEFDLLMLGMGPDIHVASLFPGHAGLNVVGVAATGVHDSPKPPPTRVSLTFEAINTAQRIWIVAGGAEKADAVQAVLEGKPVAEAPAAGVAGTKETLLLLDAASAS